MPIQFSPATAEFHGLCLRDEALALSDWLLAQEKATVDLSQCSGIDGPILQCLLAFEPALVTPPKDPLIAQLLQPLTARRSSPASAEV